MGRKETFNLFQRGGGEGWGGGEGPGRGGGVGPANLSRPLIGPCCWGYQKATSHGWWGGAEW